jgi:superfamily II DNA helicase RecQ
MEESDDDESRRDDMSENKSEGGHGAEEDRSSAVQRDEFSIIEVRVVRVVRRWLATGGRGKCVVYVPTRDGADRLGRELRCRTYHSKVGDQEEKKEILEAWIGGGLGEGGLVVATNALGLGVDVPDVRMVVHTGMPEKIRDFVQESGKAGRDGQPSESVVVHEGGKDLTGASKRCDAATEAFLATSGCRRRVLDKAMDGVDREGGCRVGEEACDHCIMVDDAFAAESEVAEARAVSEFNVAI